MRLATFWYIAGESPMESFLSHKSLQDTLSFISRNIRDRQILFR